jgi:hypothetical protein
MKNIINIVRIMSTLAKVLDVEATSKVRNASMCRIASLALRAKTSPFKTDGQLKQWIHNSAGTLGAYQHKMVLVGTVLTTCEVQYVKTLIAKGLQAAKDSMVAIEAIEASEATKVA